MNDTLDLFSSMTISPVTPRDLGDAGRDDGIARAVDHADAVVESWAERAYGFILDYARRGQPFSCADVRLEAARVGFPAPPDNHAWGGPMQRAARGKLLVRAGWENYGDAISHTYPVALWRAA